MIGLFYFEAPKLHYYKKKWGHQVATVNALADGMKECDEKYFKEATRKYKECDVMVTFGVPNMRTGKGRLLDRLSTKHGDKPHLIIERGYVKAKEYWSLGWGGLHGRANFCNKNSPEDRWLKLKAPLQPKHTKKNGYILVCANSLVGTSAGDNHDQWINDMLVQIREHTDRKIVVRHHPRTYRSKKKISTFKVNSLPNMEVRKAFIPINKDLKDAYAVVTYNSNAAIEATIAGKPTFVFDEGSMVYNLVNTDISLIENPKLPVRKQWAHDLAYAQWSLEEMKSGLAWKHLKQGLKYAYK